MPNAADLPPLKIGTGWVEIEVISDVDVTLTFKGYAPILCVRVTKTGLDYVLYITAKSLAQPLEELRQHHGGRFLGLRLRLRKQSSEQYAKYEVQHV